MIECDVCVIGAGPGGLTAASALAMRGRARLWLQATVHSWAMASRGHSNPNPSSRLRATTCNHDSDPRSSKIRAHPRGAVSGPGSSDLQRGLALISRAVCAGSGFNSLRVAALSKIATRS